LSENEKIEVVVDTSAMEAKIPEMIERALEARELEREDDGKGVNWYYVRVVQANEQYAWSSPIWVEPRGVV